MGNSRNISRESMSADSTEESRTVSIHRINSSTKPGKRPITASITSNPRTLRAEAQTAAALPGEAEPTVVVIDDDEEIREGLEGLLGSVGLRVELFASCQEFLGSARPDRPGCLLLDVRLPGRSGLDFHDDLARANVHMPVIFISGHADIPMSVRAMKAGAVEFLTKPVRHQDLLDAIQRALDQDRNRREDQKVVAELRSSLDTLTPREREVMVLVVAGLQNNQIAHDIGGAAPTLTAHRGQVQRTNRPSPLADQTKFPAH